jgi:hypothetical protein
MNIEKREKAVRQLAYDGSASLLVELMTDILRSMSARISIDFRESALRAIAFGITHEYSGYISSTEESTEDGYIDMALIPNEETVKHCHVFEFKYVPKSGFSYSNAHSAWKAALDEILRYAGSVKFGVLANRLKVKSIKKWIVIYSGYDCIVNQEIDISQDSFEMEAQPGFTLKP